MHHINPNPNFRHMVNELGVPVLVHICIPMQLIVVHRYQRTQEVMLRQPKLNRQPQGKRILKKTFLFEFFFYSYQNCSACYLLQYFAWIEYLYLKAWLLYAFLCCVQGILAHEFLCFVVQITDQPLKKNMQKNIFSVTSRQISGKNSENK